MEKCTFSIFNPNHLLYHADWDFWDQVAKREAGKQSITEKRVKQTDLGFQAGHQAFFFNLVSPLFFSSSSHLPFLLSFFFLWNMAWTLSVRSRAWNRDQAAAAVFLPSEVENRTYHLCFSSSYCSRSSSSISIRNRSYFNECLLLFS